MMLPDDVAVWCWGRYKYMTDVCKFLSRLFFRVPFHP